MKNERTLVQEFEAEFCIKAEGFIDRDVADLCYGGSVMLRKVQDPITGVQTWTLRPDDDPDAVIYEAERMPDRFREAILVRDWQRRVNAILAGLGDTAERVAYKLLVNWSKGVPCSSRRCPVAVWVQKCLGCPAKVFSANGSFELNTDRIPDGLYPKIPFMLPEPVRDFITIFDAVWTPPEKWDELLGSSAARRASQLQVHEWDPGRRTNFLELIDLKAL